MVEGLARIAALLPPPEATQAGLTLISPFLQRAQANLNSPGELACCSLPPCFQKAQTVPNLPRYLSVASCNGFQNQHPVCLATQQSRVQEFRFRIAPSLPAHALHKSPDKSSRQAAIVNKDRSCSAQQDTLCCAQAGLLLMSLYFRQLMHFSNAMLGLPKRQTSLANFCSQGKLHILCFLYLSIQSS